MYVIYRATRDKELSNTDKSLIMLLVTMSGTKGYCWPSYSHVADSMGVSRRTAIRSMQHLIDLDYVRKAKGFVGDTTEQSTNRYYLNNNPE